MQESPTTHHHTFAPWQKEFFKNIEGFIKFGINQDRARELLLKFLSLSSTTPQPKVMESFRVEEALDAVGVYTQRNPSIRDFMVEFLEPLMKNFTVEGKENIGSILPLLGRYPITLISNHISHLDAPAIYNLLYREGGEARLLAESLVFIAGRLAFEPDFTRLGLYMFDTLLVCSKRDMAENPGQADLMTKINMRSFRQAQQLQKEGKAIAIFPEGTRSRDGKLMPFVESAYHYLANRIVIPVSISGTDEILPTSTFLFNASTGRLAIGQPILVGRLSTELMESLPSSIAHLPIPEKSDKKRFVIENLALQVGQNLHRHRLGSFRNLYRWRREDPIASNILIARPQSPKERVTIIGHSRQGVAAASVLANHDCSVQIYLADAEKAEEFNDRCADLHHFPLYSLPPNVRFTADAKAIADSTLLFQAMEPWRLADSYEPLRSAVGSTKAPLINLMKGFTSSSLGLVTDDLETLFGIERERLGVMAGALSPEQILERKLSGYEIATINPAVRSVLAELFTTGYSSAHPSVEPEDIRGVQLGGALKGIYAIGMGLIDAYYEKQLGGNADNPLFHLAPFMLQEMAQIGSQCGAQRATFQGVSGMIDFMRSSFGHHTKDKNFGREFLSGKEATPTAAYFGLQSPFVSRVIEKGDHLPILKAIRAIVIEKGAPDEELQRLFSTLLK